MKLSGIPAVSVVIPCYNGERFIAEAVESVLSQTMKSLELVVVDDGSADGSREIVEKRAAEPRLRLLRHERNRGIPAARNTGIRASRGEFIAFLDQDDLWLPEKLEKQLAVFERDEKGEIGLVFTDHVVVAGDGRPRKRSRFVPPGINSFTRIDVMKALFMYNFIPMVSVLVRRRCLDAVGLLDETLRSGVDDYELCTRVVQSHRIFFVDERLVVRREHGRNYTDDARLSPDAIEINRRLAARYPELRPLLGPREGELLFKLGLAHLAKGERRPAREAMRDSIGAHPLKLKPYLALGVACLGPVARPLVALWSRVRRLP